MKITVSGPFPERDVFVWAVPRVGETLKVELRSFEVTEVVHEFNVPPEKYPYIAEEEATRVRVRCRLRAP